MPALLQVLKERLFEEEPPSVYQTINKLLSAIGTDARTGGTQAGR